MVQRNGPELWSSHVLQLLDIPALNAPWFSMVLLEQFVDLCQGI